MSQYVDAFNWQQGAVAYHIASGECTTLKKKGSRYDATAIVGVSDGSAEVSGATVTGSWTIPGVDVATGQGTTDSGGQARLKITRQSAQPGDVIRFTVTNIERGEDDLFDGIQTWGAAVAQ